MVYSFIYFLSLSKKVRIIVLSKVTPFANTHFPNLNIAWRRKRFGIDMQNFMARFTTGQNNVLEILLLAIQK